MTTHVGTGTVSISCLGSELAYAPTTFSVFSRWERITLEPRGLVCEVFHVNPENTCNSLCFGNLHPVI